MIERKVRLSGEELTFECEPLALETDYAVLKYVLPEGRNVDMVYLPAQTTTLALYYRERSYNLYFWASPLKPVRETGPSMRERGPDGANAREIAWYFNIAEPLEMSREEIAYRDLVVDVLVLPDGTAKVLDEEELPEGLDPGLAETIEETKLELLENRMAIIEEARELLRSYLSD